MQDLRWDKATNEITAEAGALTREGEVEQLSVRIFSREIFRMGFFRSSDYSDKLLDEGSPIDLQLLIKRATGDQRYDEGALASVTSFTRVGPDEIGNTWYEGELEAGAPIFQRLLGVDHKRQTEQVLITCTADVDGSLRESFFDIFTSPSAYTRFWFRVSGSGAAPPAGTGGTLAMVSIAENDTQDVVVAAVASSIAGAISGTYTQSYDGGSVTITAIAPGPKGAPDKLHTPGTTPFTITLMRAGGFGLGTADADSYTLAAQWIYFLDGAPQIAAPFEFVIYNALWRPGVTSPAAPSGTNVRAGSVAINRVVGAFEIDTATDIFSLPEHSFVAGQKIRFATTGTLPAPLATGTTYFVESVIDEDQFKVEASPGGGAINLTTVGSGTHTARHWEQDFVDVRFTTPHGSAEWRYRCAPFVTCDTDPPSEVPMVGVATRNGAAGFRVYFAAYVTGENFSIEYDTIY